MKIVVIVGFVIMWVTGCDGSSPLPLEEAVQDTWVGSMPKTEWGPMTFELTLGEEGYAHMVVFHEVEPKPIIYESDDRYSLSDGEIRFDDLFGGHTMKVLIEDGELVFLTPEDEIIFRMQRQ